VYAGELNAAGCRLVRAANIAGAASLSATADLAAQRQVIRDGVIDFLVTNLDEALRILKNEIRKRQAVAVGVAASPHQVVREMRERGVLPDLLPPAQAADSHDSDISGFLAQGARRATEQPLPPDHIVVALSHPPADFDRIALSMIPESDHATRRWLRLSPRYLGPKARRARSLVCDRSTAAGWAT
jgi:urocanate hydratase